MVFFKNLFGVGRMEVAGPPFSQLSRGKTCLCLETFTHNLMSVVTEKGIYSINRPIRPVCCSYYICKLVGVFETNHESSFFFLCQDLG